MLAFYFKSTANWPDTTMVRCLYGPESVTTVAGGGHLAGKENMMVVTRVSGPIHGAVKQVIDYTGNPSKTANRAYSGEDMLGLQFLM